MIEQCKPSDFTALELEFVRITPSEYPSTESMKEVHYSAAENNIQLSMHGSLYINLATLEEGKMKLASDHIKQGIRIATAISGNLIFHAGYFQDLSHEVAITKAISLLNSLELQNPSIIFLETPGKLNSIGDISELLEIATHTGVRIGIDWGHQYARSQGAIRDSEDILKILTEIENSINQNYFHMHISGIEYTKKGEKRHLAFSDSAFPVELVVQTVQESGFTGTFICESPKRWEGDTELVLRLLRGENLKISRKQKRTLLDYFNNLR